MKRIALRDKHLDALIERATEMQEKHWHVHRVIKWRLLYWSVVMREETDEERKGRLEWDQLWRDFDACVERFKDPSRTATQKFWAEVEKHRQAQDSP